jgi:NADP-dependent 3-hydroxy acid dehydrogenase YdfG
VKGIALLASSASKLAETEAEVKNSNPEIEILTFALDISNIQAVTSTFEKIKSKFGHADILVGAAGAMSGDGLKLHETDPEKWWRNFVSIKFPLLSPCR